MADIRSRKKPVKDKKKDALLTFGDKAMELAQKHAVLITAVVALVVVGVFVVFIMSHNAQAREIKTSDDLHTFLVEMYASPSADAALLGADKLDNLCSSVKGDKKLYPLVAFSYARACYDLGVRFDSVELLDRCVTLCKDLLQNYPDSPVTQMKDFAKVEGKKTGENLVVVLRDNAELAKKDIESADYKKATSGEGVVEKGSETPPPPEIPAEGQP
jgi:hypothetical protein